VAKDYIVKELDEIHSHGRTISQTLVAWFTFFFTTQVAALVWACSAAFDEQGKLVSKSPLVLFLVYYAIQNPLAIAACIFCYAHFKASERRAKNLYENEGSKDSKIKLQNAFPSLYRNATSLMIITIVFNCVVLIVIAWYFWGR